MTQKPRLLVVEDDNNLGQILKEYLEMKGFQTMLCRDGEEGAQAFKAHEFDLCLLDVMMPKKDGITLGKEIRKADENIPFIFLTAKNMKEDTLEGLKAGADDYITKPFSMEELLLRINAVLKRTLSHTKADEQNVFQIGKFTFQYDQHLLESENRALKLTLKEAELLRQLALHVNQPMSRTYALKKIWGDDTYFNARSMDVYITKLRKILREDERVQIITLHGEGFRLVVTD
ncbi:response regulator transcription factor [Penaeicola halotolerans]|uniref:response regulator transcription factor n=1 Tax=Penaeicola halotolerans TaxID=2793196 RepID=UPI001CF81134|nr:response regulator transcription factor [Penaeicola halotolerans]